MVDMYLHPVVVCAGSWTLAGREPKFADNSIIRGLMCGQFDVIKNWASTGEVDLHELSQMYQLFGTSVTGYVETTGDAKSFVPVEISHRDWRKSGLTKFKPKKV